MEKITLPAVAVDASLRPANREISATLSHNLRQSIDFTGTSRLQPVGAPHKLASGRWRPLVSIRPADSLSLLIVADACELAYVDLNPAVEPVSDDPQQPVLIASLPGEILCAAADGCKLTVMTAAGAQTFVFDPDDCSWRTVDLSSFSALSLIAEPLADVSFTVPSRRLSHSYSTADGSLSDGDLRAVSSDLRRAYRSLCLQAAANGAFCAPMLCRYRLIGRSGEVLFTSAPLLLCSPDSSRLTAPITVTSTDRRTLAAYELSLPQWRLRLLSSEAVPDALTSLVSRIELLASPQFHSCDSSSEASVSFVRAAASDAFLSLTLPGASAALSPSSCNASARVRRVVASISSAERVIAVVNPPFGTQPLDICPAVDGRFSDFDRDNRLIARALNADCTSPDWKQLRLAPPHRFSASLCASSSEQTLWGGLTALRFGGFPAEIFAASRSSASWHAAVEVTFASSDESVVAVSQGLTGAPLTLGPLLSYPSPDAVSMTITLSSAGSVRRRTFPLTPDPSGRFALYVDPSMSPVSLTETLSAFVIPPSRPRPLSMPSALVLTAAAEPAALMAHGSTGDDRLIALAPAARTNSDWDFSNQRFFAFTAGGIFCLSTPASRQSDMKAKLVDTSVINSPAAVTQVQGALWAMTGSRLVSVGLSGLQLIAEGIVADALAYSPAFGELWLTDSLTGSTSVYSPAFRTLYTRDEALASVSLNRYVLVGDSLVDLSAEQPQPSVYVRYDCRTAPTVGFRRFRSLCLDANVSWIGSATLFLRRINGVDVEPRSTLTCSLSGALRSPLRLPLVACRARCLELSVQGRVTSDSLISNIDLNYGNI